MWRADEKSGRDQREASPSGDNVYLKLSSDLSQCLDQPYIPIVKGKDVRWRYCVEVELMMLDIISGHLLFRQYHPPSSCHASDSVPEEHYLGYPSLR